MKAAIVCASYDAFVLLIVLSHGAGSNVANVNVKVSLQLGGMKRNQCSSCESWLQAFGTNDDKPK